MIGVCQQKLLPTYLQCNELLCIQRMVVACHNYPLNISEEDFVSIDFTSIFEYIRVGFALNYKGFTGILVEYVSMHYDIVT